MSKQSDGCIGAIIIAVIATIFVVVVGAHGYRLGSELERATFQQEAIELGYAEYNAVTGEWQWKINPENVKTVDR